MLFLLFIFLCVPLSVYGTKWKKRKTNCVKINIRKMKSNQLFFLAPCFFFILLTKHNFIHISLVHIMGFERDRKWNKEKRTEKYIRALLYFLRRLCRLCCVLIDACVYKVFVYKYSGIRMRICMSLEHWTDGRMCWPICLSGICGECVKVSLLVRKSAVNPRRKRETSRKDEDIWRKEPNLCSAKHELSSVRKIWSDIF